MVRCTWLRGFVAFVALALFAGCAKTPTAPRVAGPPNADSPENTVRRLEYAWNHRDADMYSDLFTADFQVTPIAADSADAVLLAWGRDAEERTSTTIFVGDAIHPHVSAIAVALDATLLATNDPSPGAAPPWHRQVTTSASLDLTIALSNGLSDAHSYRGGAIFHLVRGDSAQIPASLAAHGVVPDSTRWWIRGWVDQPGTGTDSSWQQVKRLFY